MILTLNPLHAAESHSQKQQIPHAAQRRKTQNIPQYFISLSINEFVLFFLKDDPQMRHIPIAGEQGERSAAGCDPGAAAVLECVWARERPCLPHGTSFPGWSATRRLLMFPLGAASLTFTHNERDSLRPMLARGKQKNSVVKCAECPST